MTLQALPAPIVWVPPALGGLVGITTGLGSATGLAINGANDKVAFVFQALSSVCPDVVSFYVSAFTTGGTVDCTIQTLDTSGFPSGTLVTNSGTATRVVAATGVQESGTGIAGTASLTPGALYALVLTAAAGFAGTFTIAHSFGTTGLGGLPYALTKDSAGAWAKTTGSTAGFLCSAKDNSGSVMYLSGLTGAAAPAYQAFSNATNPDERGNRFVLPFAAEIGGCLVIQNGGTAPAAADAHTVKLLSNVSNGSTPVEEATHVMAGYDQAASAGKIYRFATPFTASAGVAYGLTVKADSTDSMSFVRWDFPSNAALASFMGIDFHEINRNNAGTVTMTSTEQARVYGIFPLITALDDGAGGGGGGGGVIGSRIFTGM